MSGETSHQEHIGPYRLLSRLGGHVHRAAGPDGRDVALRMLPAGRRYDIERMRHVLSPYVVDVLGGDTAADRPYLVSRFVPGRPLDEELAERGPLRGSVLRRMALGLAKALAAIHETGLAHGDLVPRNVLMVDDAPVVVDFAVTPHGDPSQDIFAWATVVAHAAIGERENTSPATIPEPLRPLLLAASAPDPAARPTAHDLAIQAALLDLGPTPRPTPPPHPAPIKLSPPTPAPTPPPAPAPSAHAAPGAHIAPSFDTARDAQAAPGVNAAQDADVPSGADVARSAHAAPDSDVARSSSAAPDVGAGLGADAVSEADAALGTHAARGAGGASGVNAAPGAHVASGSDVARGAHAASGAHAVPDAGVVSGAQTGSGARAGRGAQSAQGGPAGSGGYVVAGGGAGGAFDAHALGVAQAWARLLSVMVVVIAVAVTIVMPVPGLVLSVCGLVALGASPSGGRVGAVARAAATLVLAAVIAVIVPVGLAGMAAFSVEVEPLVACAYGAGAASFVLWTSLGANGPRRRLERAFMAVARVPRRIAAAGVALGVLAFLSVVAAISVTPSFAPLYGTQHTLQEAVGRLQTSLLCDRPLGCLSDSGLGGRDVRRG
ncbi:protein kinase domain-containing protein [Spirillospora sp. CA-294931]|uniref:protein kinase domain-containing protein n=1 Tax=Spirillospora sp. CA-294931 TaxID=3240042 RepID=UPI003D8CDF6F